MKMRTTGRKKTKAIQIIPLLYQ